MPTPTRIQLRRTKGWRKPPGTVVVSRPGKWGNPFSVGGEISSIEESVALFRKMMNDPGSLPVSNAVRGKFVRIIGDIEELRGKNLACWCKVGAPCHGDVLLEIANK